MQKNKPTQKKLFYMYIFIVAVIVGCFLLLATLTIFVLGFLNDKIVPNVPGVNSPGLTQDKKNIFNEIYTPIAPIKEHTNFLILGFDDDGSGGTPRTDTVMVGCFNAVTKEISIISVPRDTYVVIPKERRDILKEKGKQYPSTGEMKLNEVYHYAGDELGMDFVCRQLEEMLNIDIEFYLKINFEAMKYIVNSIGGVEFNVPQAMKYDDPVQNLHINLRPGLQVLDGDKAEQLLRYRHGNFGEKNATPAYPMQDLGRVEVQQNFMKELFSQVLSKENIVNSLPSLINTYYQYVETNFSLGDLPKYLKYVKEIHADSVHTYTLPGTPKMMGNKDFIMIIQSEANALADKVFYQSGLTVKKTDSKAKRIQILNGGYTSGLASKKKDYLTSKGYKDISIGDYKGGKQSLTRIFVRQNGDAQDLLELFPESSIELNKDMAADYDIVVILGTDEA